MGKGDFGTFKGRRGGTFYGQGRPLGRLRAPRRDILWAGRGQGVAFAWDLARPPGFSRVRVGSCTAAFVAWRSCCLFIIGFMYFEFLPLNTLVDFQESVQPNYNND